MVRSPSPGNSSGEDDTGVRLTFLLTDDPATRRLWDHAFRLELEMSIGAELQLALRMLNTGGAAFTVSGALHSYLAVGGIGQIHLTGLENAAYLDTVGSPQVRRQDGPLVIDREVDRNYRHAAPVAVHDAGLHRTLTITGSGSQCTVVWNPWIDKAKTLTDLPDPAYQNFICVETANTWEDLITLAPGESHTLATTVRVR